MVRRLSKIAVLRALLVLVASCTVAYLYSTVDAASAATARVVAIGAAVVVVVGILARGQGGAALAKVRQVIGAVGLFLTPVAAALTLFALVDPPMIRWFVLLTVLALLAWMQGVAAQTGLSLRVTARWFVLMLVFALAALALGVVIALVSAGALEALGLDPDASRRVAFGLALASNGAVLFAWAKGRRDRRALGGAIGRAAFGRANPGDIGTAGRRPAADPAAAVDVRHRACGPARARHRSGCSARRRSMPRWPIRSPAHREAPAGDR